MHFCTSVLRGDNTGWGPIMKIITVRLSLIAGLLLSSRGVSQAQSSSDGGVCSTTANVAQTACDHDVADSYWIAVGRCLNTSDSAKRESCLAEARDARTETGICVQNSSTRATTSATRSARRHTIRRLNGVISSIRSRSERASTQTGSFHSFQARSGSTAVHRKLLRSTCLARSN